MYCQGCKIVFEEGERCPFCGSKKVRNASPEDICFLTEADPIMSGMLKDVLEQNNIPALNSSTIGAGMAMRAGSMFERTKFYVRYEHLATAKEIVDELFNSPIIEEYENEKEC